MTALPYRSCVATRDLHAWLLFLGTPGCMGPEAKMQACGLVTLKSVSRSCDPSGPCTCEDSSLCATAELSYYSMGQGPPCGVPRSSHDPQACFAHLRHCPYADTHACVLRKLDGLWRNAFLQGSSCSLSLLRSHSCILMLGRRQVGGAGGVGTVADV